MNDTNKEKLSVSALRAAKGRQPKLTMVTAYDYPSALLVDRAPIDMILVGDSLGNTVLGYEGTVAVTMAEMLHHLRAVVRGVSRTLVVCDLPFGSYQVSPAQAIKHATKLLKAGAECVKLEGGADFAATAAALTRAGIPVVGHVGLLPQTVHPSAWRVQGRDAARAHQIVDDATALCEAGVVALVLEAVPAPLAAHITAQATVPTIGIAAGPSCDGQVLVWHDLLGLLPRRSRHVRRFAVLDEVIVEALARYSEAVRSGEYPGAEHSYTMKPEQLAAAMKDGGLAAAVDDASQHVPSVPATSAT